MTSIERDTALTLLMERAERDADSPLLRVDGGTLTSAEVASGVEAVAAGLASLGVRPGDRVAVMADNCRESVWSWLGANAAAAIDVPLNTALQGQALAVPLSSARPRVVIGTAAYLARLHDGAGLDLLEGRIRATIDGTPASLAAEADALRAWSERTFAATRSLWSGGDPEVALANTTRHADAIGHVVVAWLWLQQMVTADGKEGAFYDGKRVAGRYFLRHMLPDIGPTLDLLEARDRMLLDLDPDCL